MARALETAENMGQRPSQWSLKVTQADSLATLSGQDQSGPRAWILEVQLLTGWQHFPLQNLHCAGGSFSEIWEEQSMLGSL